MMKTGITGTPKASNAVLRRPSPNGQVTRTALGSLCTACLILDGRLTMSCSSCSITLYMCLSWDVIHVLPDPGTPTNMYTLFWELDEL